MKKPQEIRMPAEFPPMMQETFVSAPSTREGHIVNGVEKPDPTPMSPPLGHKYQEPLALQIRRMVRSEALQLAAESAGMETFEEADDFDVDDGEHDLPGTQWENEFDPPIKTLVNEGHQQLTKKQKAAAAAAAAKAAKDTPRDEEDASGGAEGVS